MKALRRLRPELIGLIIAAFATRLWELTTPNAVVFDEVYFKAFAGHYIDHHYFFDIHPPLGKLLLAGWAALCHIPAATLTSTTDPATALRYLPAIAGALIVPVFWGILRRLGANRPLAFLGALALLADNALLVESRFILIDSMLVLFGLTCFYLYQVSKSASPKMRWLWLSLTAVAGGAAMSTKWTGLTAIGVVGLAWLFEARSLKPGRRLAELAILIIIPLAVYASAFWVHFQLLPNSGDGDAFMSPAFQSTLIGNASYDPNVHLSFVDKFVQLNVEMYKANQTLTATHPYASRWYSWPLEIRPVYYWEGDALPNGAQGNIYLLGNPIVWWGIIIAGISGLMYRHYNRIKLRPRTIMALGITAIAYIANLAPFIPVVRVMFLYHYFYAFIFSLAFVVLLWNDLASERDSKLPFENYRKLVYAVLVIAVIAGFIFFAPLSYGSPLSTSQLAMREWLTSWR